MLLTECVPSLGKDLIEDIQISSVPRSFKEGDFIVKEGSYVKYLPIVLSGHVRIYSEEEHFQFLLYYLGPGEACIFSFAHLQNEEKAEFSAIAEVDSDLLLLPVSKVSAWQKHSVPFNQMLVSAYQKHYQELLYTTRQVICYNLEERLKIFLKTKVSIEGEPLLAMSHQQIADALGTSREVVSRLIKKLAHSGAVEQAGRKIKVLL